MTAMLFPGQTDGKVWVTKAGIHVPITQMDDGHLDNSIKMLEGQMKRRIAAVALLKKEQKMRALGAKAMKDKLKIEKLGPVVGQTAGRMFRDNP